MVVLALKLDLLRCYLLVDDGCFSHYIYNYSHSCQYSEYRKCRSSKKFVYVTSLHHVQIRSGCKPNGQVFFPFSIKLNNNFRLRACCAMLLWYLA